MSVILQGETRTYHIDCTRTNALVQLEEETGRSFRTLVNALNADEPDSALVVQFLRAVLVDPAAHSEADLVAILEDIGGPTVIAAAAAGVA